MVRALVPSFALFFALTVALAMWLRPAEGEPPWRGGGAAWELAIDDLTVRGGDHHPAFTARRAAPLRGGAALTLGGTFRGLTLHDVEVALADGLAMQAPHGSLLGDRLTLSGDVAVGRGANRILSAGSVEFHGSRVRFPGVVVLRGRGAATTAVGVEFEVGDLASRLR